MLTTAALVWPQIPARVPVFVWRLSVPTIVALVVADFYLGNEVLPVLIRLAVLLVLYRAVSYRRKREDLQLIVLGLFLIVVAGVLTVSIGFALLLLVFTACALGFLFVITLIDMVDTGPRVMRPEEMRTVPSWARPGWGRFFPRFRQAANWRLILFSSTLFTVVVAFSAVLFLLIPRFELASGFFLDRYITRKAHTGFNETVRFGDVGELVRRRKHGHAGGPDRRPVGAIRNAPYWRLVMLDEYNSLRASGCPPASRPNSSTASAPSKPSSRSHAARHGCCGQPADPGCVYVEPGVSRFLPIPGGFAALRLRNQLSVQSSWPQRLLALRSEPVAMFPFHARRRGTAGRDAARPGFCRAAEGSPAHQRFGARGEG